MKKIIIILAALLVMISLVACDNGNDNNNNTNIDIPTGAPVENPTDPNGETPSEQEIPAVDRNFEDKNDTVFVMTPNGAANLRTDTSFESSAIAISIENNTELERLQADDDWSKVVYEGEEYYISNKVIVAADMLNGFEEVSKTVKITVASVYVRFVPARTSDAPIFTLLENDEVEVVGFNSSIGEEGWYKIKLTVTEDQPYEFGYISAYHEYSEEVVEGNTETNVEDNTEAA